MSDFGVRFGLFNINSSDGGGGAFKKAKVCARHNDNHFGKILNFFWYDEFSFPVT